MADSEPAPFPLTPDDFDKDPRVSFSKADQKWILENLNGSEWEWSFDLNRWIPLLDEDLVRQQAQAYAIDGVDENEPVAPPKQKRKRDDEAAGKKNGKNQKKARQEQLSQKNKAVYATGIPLDATVQEINDVFARCGMVAESVDKEGEPRIKMYKDDDGNFKGEALIIYFRPESVDLAIQLLDDSDFRPGSGSPYERMRVQEAESSYKKHANDDNAQKAKDDIQADKSKGNGAGGNKKGKPSKDQQRVIRRTQEMNNKLADWSSDEEPQSIPTVANRFNKIVILKHMFTLKEIDDDPAAILDIKQDIRDECEKLGAVTNVVLYDQEPDGVVTVRFTDSEAAVACVKKLDGRVFAGQAVDAYIADGPQKFKKTKDKARDGDDDDNGEPSGEQKRLEEFGKWLDE